MRHVIRVFVILAACLVGLPTLSGANEPEFVGSSASHTQTLDCDTKAKNFEPFALGWLVDGLDVVGGETSVRCTTSISNEKGKGRKGVKVKLDAELLNTAGQVIDDLGSRSGRTNNAGQKVFDFDIPDDFVDFLVSISGSYGGNKKGVTATTTCTARSRVPCTPDDTTVCLLGDDRFKVNVDWRSSSGSGEGEVVSSGFDDVFFFFDPDAGDMLVQLLDRCSINGHFWVFASATTGVQYTLTVTDTETGAVKSYFNPLGQAAPAIIDTSAFATCP